jgi:hypothetical protein
VENYEKVGKILMSLVATYGAYKAAVIAVTIAQNVAKQAATGYTIAQQLQYKWLLMVEKAQKLLNATMLKNPYVLAAVAVVGLVSAIWTLHNAVTAEEEAQKRLNDELDRQKEARDTAASNAEKYFGIIKDGTQTIEAQLTALKALKEKLPKAFDKMSLKDIQKMTLEEFSIKINVATDEKKLADAVQTYEDAKNKILRIKKDIEIAYRTPDSGTYVSSLNSELKDAEAFAELAKKSLDELYSIRREAEFEAKTDDEKLAYYNRELDALRNRRNEIQAIIRESENVSEFWKADPFASFKNQAMLQLVLNKIADIEGKKGALAVGNTTQTVAERVKELNQQIKTEEHKFASLQLPTAIANPEEIKKATDNLQNYRKELQLLTGEKPSKAQKPKKEDALIAERKNIQDQITLWERYFKYVEHGYTDMAGNTYAQLAQQDDTLDAYLEKAERSLRERLTQVGLSDEDRQKLQDSLDIVIEAQIKVNRDKSQEEQELKSFLKEYGTFTQKNGAV